MNRRVTWMAKQGSLGRVERRQGTALRYSTTHPDALRGRTSLGEYFMMVYVWAGHAKGQLTMEDTKRTHAAQHVAEQQRSLSAGISLSVAGTY